MARRPEKSALDKIQKWCAFQERSQQETRLKLGALGIVNEEAEELIAALISENFINEERFATAYAGGKFRMKGWGKKKIKAGLRKHKISEEMIKKSFLTIPDADYKAQAIKFIDQKLKSLLNESDEKKFHATLNHLFIKGFESELVIDLLNSKIKSIEQNES
jgi:regulatory protein